MPIKGVAGVGTNLRITGSVSDSRTISYASAINSSVSFPGLKQHIGRFQTPKPQKFLNRNLSWALLANVLLISMHFSNHWASRDRETTTDCNNMLDVRTQFRLVIRQRYIDRAARYLHLIDVCSGWENNWLFANGILSQRWRQRGKLPSHLIDGAVIWAVQHAFGSQSRQYPGMHRCRYPYIRSLWVTSEVISIQCGFSQY